MTKVQTEQLVMTTTGTSSFIFEWGGLTGEQEKRILRNGPKDQSYHLVNDRIIQKYLEDREYDVDVFVYPFSLMNWGYPTRQKISRNKRRKESAGRTVCFILKQESGRKSDFTYYMEQMQFWLTVMGPGTQGIAMIDVWEIYRSVQWTRKEIAQIKEPTLTISQVSEHFWTWNSTNLKGTIHNWMQGIPYTDRQRIPVFSPETQVRKADNKGCRLSVSDITTIGLLSGLFSHGVKSYDFAGPSEFYISTPEEIRQYATDMLSAPFSEHKFTISEPKRGS